MKKSTTFSARAIIALFPVMLAAPAFAQALSSQTTPPPIPIATTTVAPPPVVATVADVPPPPAFRSASIQAAPALPAAPVRTAAQVARPVAATRVATRTVSTPPSAVVAVQAPVTVTPATPVAAPAPAPIVPPSTVTPTAASPAPLWPWIVGAVVGLVGLAMLLRRRRVDEVPHEEPVYVEPAYREAAVLPIAATGSMLDRHRLDPAAFMQAAPAPVPAEDMHVVDADRADVAALTEGHATVADRPWLEFGMRPVRAGTTADEALVEIELTVGNAGSVAADDVRISTFVVAQTPADSAAFERMLLDGFGHDGEGMADPVSIAAGEGARVDATLALPKADLAALFQPVVVADARYRLPDGSEGRTLASFAIGMTQEDGALGAMANRRPAMHEDVEARLYGTPEHV